MVTGPSTSYGVAKDYKEIAQQLPEVHNERFDMSVDDIQNFSDKVFQENQDKIVKYTEYVNGFCMMAKAVAFKHVGLLDTDFGFGSREEVQFVDRLRTEGYEVGWVQSAYVHHYGNRSFDAYPDSKQLWEKNKVLYHSTKGQKKLVDTTTLKVAFIYGDKFSSSTRKRTFEPFKYLKNLIDIDAIHWPRVTNEYIKSKDIIIFQRLGGLNEVIKEHFVNEISKWTEQYQGKSKYFIYDIDDLVIQSQDKLPIRLMKLCDAVTVTTDSLKKNVTKYNENVTVLKNGVDMARFNLAQAMHKNDKIKSIVYFSLAGCGAKEAEELATTLNKSHPKQFEVIFFSSAIDKNDERFQNLKILDNVTLDVLFSHLKTADYVVNWGEHSDEYLKGLTDKYALPKRDYNNFINSKSGLKYYNSAIAKCVFFSTSKPAVYSELVKPNFNGFIISNVKEISNKIIELEKNTKLKDSIIMNAYLDVVSNYTLANTSYDYLKFFSKVQVELESKQN
jgi:glycosyltransferase involved in cell wall biosynthesis